MSRLEIRVFLSVDFDADSAERLYYPECPVKISKALFGINVGVERLLNLLKRYDIKTTFFIPGWTAEKYPHRVEKIVKEGHEIALHGYRHEKLNELSPEKELEVFERSLEILKRFGEVYGFRKPYWELSKETLDIISQKGIIYDSSLRGGDFPYWQETKKGKLVELPIEDILDDWLLFEIDRRSSKEVFYIWQEEFSGIRYVHGWYFPLILHPACIGRGSRLAMLEKLITFFLNNGAVFRRGIDIAREFVNMAGNQMASPPIL